MSDAVIWQQAADILCVRLDSMGDVLMTTPAIRALKQARPDRRLTLLTSPVGAAVAALVPEIDDVIVHDAPWMKAARPRATSAADHALIDGLRERGFDAAVIFTVYSQNPLPAALTCYLADIPRRLAHCRENPYGLLTDWVPDYEPERGIRHEVRRQLDLVASTGARPSHERLSLTVPDAARERIARVLTEMAVETARPWVLVHPGASAASRRYPPASFAEVCRQLVRQDGYSVLFTGNDDERALVEGIQRAMDAPSHSLAGRLTLPELCALIECAPLLIANNTGPVHIAAAVGTPVVDLYALTNPQHTPWAVPNRVLFHDVPCRFCTKSVCPEGHHDCLRLVSPDAVARAARELLAERGRRLVRGAGVMTPTRASATGGPLPVRDQGIQCQSPGGVPDTVEARP